ncbi:hypothetical protein NE237_002514 [Protea cynaroides]|uniref:Polygalacturonase n=1 Tax=Protea cynaroides TaxID=273540 RepID=A0A9Q0KV33_9MAGN|nr:hypothetical protein NE237_002514 [Protea cynaroides]
MAPLHNFVVFINGLEVVFAPPASSLTWAPHLSLVIRSGEEEVTVAKGKINHNISSASEEEIMANKGVFILSLFCLASLAWVCSGYVPSDASSENIFDVMNFGAIGDAETDDSPAFLKAWDMACKSTEPSTLSIPDKTFLLNPVDFSGPCTPVNINVQISGKLIAPSDMSEWKDSNSWISFHSINGLKITGSGTAEINGRGSSWWQCKKDEKCSKVPNTLLISNSVDLGVNGLKFIDSPKMHLVIDSSSKVQVSQLSIVAPEDSPNTDGIHVTHSQDVQITDSFIGTGDDCISIQTGSSNVIVSQIKCGPGHGISIGSLGDVEEAMVEQIHVSDCQFTGTQTGARIKSWQGGSGFARDITFENLDMTSVEHPIVINQFYCNGGHDCKNQIRGTSSKKVAIDLACSNTVPCTNINLKDIDLTSNDSEKEITAYCDGVDGTAASVKPEVKCLAQQL